MYFSGPFTLSLSPLLSVCSFDRHTNTNTHTCTTTHMHTHMHTCTQSREATAGGMERECFIGCIHSNSSKAGPSCRVVAEVWVCLFALAFVLANAAPSLHLRSSTSQSLRLSRLRTRGSSATVMPLACERQHQRPSKSTNSTPTCLCFAQFLFHTRYISVVPLHSI